MADKTATQNLTRPQSTDLVRDQWLFQRTLARELDARHAGHDADIARSRTPPMTLLRASTWRTYNLVSGVDDDRVIQWDEVIVDTAGAANLSLNPKYLTIPEPGYWHAGCYALSAGVFSGNYFDLRISMAGYEYWNSERDGGIGDLVACHTTIEQQVSAYDQIVTTQLNYTANGTGINTIEIRDAYLWLYKVRDL